MREIRHKILIVFTALTIIGEVLSIFLWVTNRPLGPEPSARFSLSVDYLIAVANAAVFAALNAVALAWIIRRNKLGAPLLIGISIINRVISDALFIGGAHGIFITWTTILVVFAYNEWRGLSNFETAFFALGTFGDLVLSSLLFTAADASLGLVFYFAVLAVLFGVVVAKRKLRR